MIQSVHKLNIAQNNMAIDNNYLEILDVYKRSLCSLMVMCMDTYSLHKSNVLFEDTEMRGYFEELYNLKLNGVNVALAYHNSIPVEAQGYRDILNDLSTHIDGWMSRSFKPCYNNIVNITITGDYHLMLTIKCCRIPANYDMRIHRGQMLTNGRFF